jgi:hypothetical protein
VAVSPSGYFLKTPLTLLAQLPKPLGGTLLQLVVIPILPGTGGGLERFELPQAHQLFLSGLGEKTTALTAADQHVNVLNQLLGEYDVNAFGNHW